MDNVIHVSTSVTTPVTSLNSMNSENNYSRTTIASFRSAQLNDETSSYAFSRRTNNCYESCTDRSEILTRLYREHFARVFPCSPCKCSCTGRRSRRTVNFSDSSYNRIARASSTSSSMGTPSCRNRTCVACDNSTWIVQPRLP